ncbi:MAG: Ig-like domain-containing protein, partial [Actinobacteria bacterium]|nr:Ig-like domain-containing protein [Actinomycetota bacterium]
MKRRIVAGLVISLVLLTLVGPANASGVFNPQYSVTVNGTNNGLVNRANDLKLEVTQMDEEDPIVTATFDSPPDWQFPFAGLRQAQDSVGNPTTDCDRAANNLDDSYDQTAAPGGPTSYELRHDAYIQRAVIIGAGHLEVHGNLPAPPGDTDTRANPIVFDGDLSFISWDSATETAHLCILFVTADRRGTEFADPVPDDGLRGQDDVEGATELVAEFTLQHIAGTAWRIFIDDTNLVQNQELQALDIRLTDLRTTFFHQTIDNCTGTPPLSTTTSRDGDCVPVTYQTGGNGNFVKNPQVSGAKVFKATFTTCPAIDDTPNHDWGTCTSPNGPVTRTAPIQINLPAPSITSPTSGQQINTNPVTVTGTADPSATVHVYDGAAAIGNATADGTGVWSLPKSFASGAHTLTAKTYDANGTSPASAPVAFTEAPAAPVITTPVEGALVDRGDVSIKGTAQGNSTVKVYEGASVTASTTATAGGAWSTTVNMTDRTVHTITATATALGAESLPSTPRSFTVTTKVPVITTPVEDAAIASNSITVAGTSEAGAAIDIAEGTTALGSTVADGSGAWSTILTLAEERSYAITATATLDALSSPASPTRTFAIDFTAPVTTITTPTEGAEVASNALFIGGLTEPRSTVTVKEGTITIGTTVANTAGAWSIHPVMDPVQHTVTAFAVDRAGNLEKATATRTFTVVVSATIENPAQNAVKTATFTVSGSTDNAVTHVIIQELKGATWTQVGDAPASGGHWTKSLTFTRGSHQIRAQAFVGTTPGKTSEVRTFTVDNSAPANTIAGPPGAAQG